MFGYLFGFVLVVVDYYYDEFIVCLMCGDVVVVDVVVYVGSDGF